MILDRIENAEYAWDELGRRIHFALYGDDKTHGLYRTVLGSQNWETFQRTAGIIQGYEQVLTEMQKIVRRANGEGEELHEQPRRGLN